MMSSDLDRRPLHVVFFPFLATGHMPPMVDMANLFAARRGVTATVVTTPANGPLVDSRRIPGATVGLRIIPFPSPALTGLPPGVENIADISDHDSMNKFLAAVLSLREPFRRLLHEILPVDAVVTDYFFPWSIAYAEELGIPRLVFHGTGFFALCATSAAAAAIAAAEGGDTVVLSGLPHRVEMLRSQMSDVSPRSPLFRELLEEIAATEGRSYGTVVNSFYDLEPDYVRHFRESTGHRTWHVGPVALHNQDGEEVQGQEKAPGPTGSSSYVLEWLDRNQPGSVLYVCFGSMGRVGRAQLGQLAFGLEAAGCPFIWAVRDSDDENDAEWMPHGFKERVKDRGLVLKGWAPQTLILGHASVGSFVTHCGWNSCLEGIGAGVPMVTWPFFADQFFNERLIVDVLGIGVPVGSTKFGYYPEERPVIAATSIENAIRKAMDGGEEAAEMRRRVRELGESAKRATEAGGSSYVDLENLFFLFPENKQAQNIFAEAKSPHQKIKRNCSCSRKCTGLRE